MRRKDREVTDFDTIVKIIDACEIIHIGLADGEYPYIVPMNFGYHAENGKIEFFIHGAMAGRKYELMQKIGKCSFEMEIPLKIDCLYDSKDVTMRYKCVMGTASIEFLEGTEKEQAMDHYIMARNEETRNFAYNKAALAHTALAKLTVLELTAKVNPIAGGAD